MKKNKILFGDDSVSKLESGIFKMAKAVKSTLGPRGKTVIIESLEHKGGFTVTKDGVTVARSIWLEDPSENLAVRMIREAASKTATQAGDGTTTSIVLVEALLNAYKKYTNDRSNVTSISRHIRRICEEISEDSLGSISREISGDDLTRVAVISANNDEDLGGVIANAYKEAGEDGVVIADKSANHKTYFEVSSGMQFKRGLLSRYSVTDHEKYVCEMENPLILLSTVELPSLASIEAVLTRVMRSNRSLLIVSPMTQEASQTLNHNLANGLLKACHILPPHFGAGSTAMMSDMAISFGCKFIDQDQGDSWEMLQFEDLGEASKVVVTRDTTSITRQDNDEVSERISKKVSDLRARIKDEDDDNEIEVLNERIARLTGRVATVYVGAGSDIEQKEKKDRTDDAILATKAAIEEGILPGGGLPLFRVANKIKAHTLEGDDVASIANQLDPSEVAEIIIREALREPIKQIIRNSGRGEDEVNTILDKIKKEKNLNVGFDAKNDEITNLVDAGIIDPTKVTKRALLNAVSVSTTIMTTSAMITDVDNDLPI